MSYYEWDSLIEETLNLIEIKEKKEKSKQLQWADLLQLAMPSISALCVLR